MHQFYKLRIWLAILYKKKLIGFIVFYNILVMKKVRNRTAKTSTSGDNAGRHYIRNTQATSRAYDFQIASKIIKYIQEEDRF